MSIINFTNSNPSSLNSENLSLRRILPIHPLALFPIPVNLFPVVEVILDRCLNLLPRQERKLPLICYTSVLPPPELSLTMQR